LATMRNPVKGMLLPSIMKLFRKEESERAEKWKHGQIKHFTNGELSAVIVHMKALLIFERKLMSILWLIFSCNTFWN
jgi:hypothetical protein